MSNLQQILCPASRPCPVLVQQLSDAMKEARYFRVTLAAALVFFLALAGQSVSEEYKRPNFLIIAIDDLNDYVGCLGGHPNAATPNLDRFARDGVLFTHAYCNSPVCRPSRTSLWTGLRPTTTGIVSNRHGWFRDLPEFKSIVTLPQALATAGYSTSGFGKLFHVGRPSDSAVEWQRSNIYQYGPRQNPKLNYPHGDRITDWGVPKENTDRAASHDPTIADRVIAALEDSYGQPFLLGCGFYRPHTPLYASQQWFDRHPRAGIALPETPADDNDDLVYFGQRERRPQDVEAPGLFTQDWAEENDTWRDVLQAYLACTSAMDHQLGRVLDALAASRHRDNTYVILFSDHGWHLGEKRHWGKAALWEQTTRIPFVIAGPGIPEGVRCDHPVDLLTIYPTIMDYAGTQPPHALDGHSLRPILDNPESEWPHPVLTTFVDHHALRTDRWRYIRYASGEEELYDHDSDPDEFENLAVTQPDSPSVAEALKRLRHEMETILQ
jgi:arylsulfatase A-like enzyme